VTSYFDVARRITNFMLGQRDLATVDDEDHAHFFAGQILGAFGRKEPLQSFATKALA
jgi:hypothetical protein